MSFNANNLSYEPNEPAFLRRLRGEHGARESSRHERPMARPKKQVLEEGKDDQPTYVVEDSQDALSKAEYEALVASNDADKQKENNTPVSAEGHHGTDNVGVRKDEVTREAVLLKQQVAGIGCSSKRRLAKVVGDGRGKEVEIKEEDTSATGRSESREKNRRNRAKTGKRMKLSFDEEGTEA